MKLVDLGARDTPLAVFGGPYSNLHAAQALLASTTRLGIAPRDTICTGDLVAYCGAPAQTVALIRAAGLPVVSGRNPGVANMIVDGETGILTDMGDAAGFAEAVLFYLRNPDALSRHGDAARANVARRHDLNHAEEVLFGAINTVMKDYS